MTTTEGIAVEPSSDSGFVLPIRSASTNNHFVFILELWTTTVVGIDLLSMPGYIPLGKLFPAMAMRRAEAAFDNQSLCFFIFIFARL